MRIFNVRWPPDAVALVVAFFIAAFLPLNAYWGNGADFSNVRPWMLVSAAACLFVALYCLLAVLLVFLRRWKVVQAFAMALLSSLVVAAYVQGQLINLDYGLLDGREIPWDRMVGAGMVNMAVWLAIIVSFALTAARYGERCVAWIQRGMGVLFCYLVLVTVLHACCSKCETDYPAGFSKRGLGELSLDRNVIVLVLDSLDRHLMDRLLEARPVWRQKLKGFTYYRNAIGLFPLTHFALPHLITGIADENRTNFAAYKDAAYGNSPILRSAGRNGFQVGIYTDLESSPSGRALSCIPCILNGVSRRPGLRDAVDYWVATYNASVFSYLPHFLKRRYGKFQIPRLAGSSRPDGDAAIGGCEDVEAALFDRISRKAFDYKPGNRYRVYHCFGTHLPHYDVDTLERCLRKVCELVAQLRENGVYEKCTLIVLADHGQENRATPVFMCNNAGEEFVETDLPFSYSDFPRVVDQALSGALPVVVPESVGARKFLYNKYFDCSGKELLDVSNAKHVYQGEDLTQLRTTKMELETADGRFWIWTLGSHSSIEIPLPADCRRKDVFVSVSILQALLGDRHPQFAVEVSVGNEVLFRRIVRKEEKGGLSFDFVVPARLQVSEALKLEIGVDAPTTPNFLMPAYGDYRSLGLRIGSVLVDAGDKIPATFSFDKPSRAYTFLSGFAEREPGNGCWTASTSAGLALRIPQDLRANVACVRLTCSPFLFGDKVKAQHVTISCRGKTLYDQCVTRGGDQEVSLTIDPEDCEEGMVRLDFSLPNAVSPRAVGFSDDPRQLSVLLKSCDIRSR